jgi:hydroxymethylbilane synthase
VTAAVLRLGTRKSPMAIAQSEQIARMITDRTGRAVELVGITTFGDVTQGELASIGGTGVFVSALRTSLLHGDVDLAVHSLKDLPAAPAPGLLLAAVPPRDDPRDVLAARGGAKLADLPAGAKIGTGSPRRAAQLRTLRPDLQPVPVRGNAGTRLGRITSGEVDAVLLAYAGLARLGRLDAVTQVFEPDEMLPAPGQGALAVECRADDTDLADLLALLDDPVSHLATDAERGVLAALQAGCSAPIGAYAAPVAAPAGSPGAAGQGLAQLRLSAVVVSADGTVAVRACATGPATEAARLGQKVADKLRRGGAEKHMASTDGLFSRGDDDR